MFGIGSIGGGKGDVGKMLHLLNFEVGKMLNEPLEGPLGTLTQDLAKLSQTFAKANAGSPAGGMADKLAKAQASGVFAKIMYIAVLKRAIAKASGQHSFNVETAINDLLVSLDPVRNMQGNAATGGGTLDVEMAKLKRSLQTQQNMVDLTSQLMGQFNQANKQVTGNLR